MHMYFKNNTTFLEKKTTNLHVFLVEWLLAQSFTTSCVGISFYAPIFFLIWKMSLFGRWTLILDSSYTQSNIYMSTGVSFSSLNRFSVTVGESSIGYGTLISRSLYIHTDRVSFFHYIYLIAYMSERIYLTPIELYLEPFKTISAACHHPTLRPFRDQREHIASTAVDRSRRICMHQRFIERTNLHSLSVL